MFFSLFYVIHPKVGVFMKDIGFLLLSTLSWGGRRFVKWLASPFPVSTFFQFYLVDVDCLRNQQNK